MPNFLTRSYRLMRWIGRGLLHLWALPTTALGAGFVLLSLMTGGRARCRGGVIECRGGFAAWYLRKGVGLILPGGARAMTLGEVVIAVDEAALRQTRRHERVHVQQCRRWGPAFLPAYFIASIYQWLRGRDAYRDNPFERAAFSQCATAPPLTGAAAGEEN